MKRWKTAWVFILVMLFVFPCMAFAVGERQERGPVSFWDRVWLQGASNLIVGNGTPSVTLNGEDAYIEGTLEVDGAARFDGAATFNSTIGISGATTLGSTVAITGALTVANDITASVPTSNGDGGQINQLIGVPRVKFVALGAGTSGAAAGKTVTLMDDTPAGEYSASDADVTCTDSTTHTRFGTNALKLAATTAADAADGCHDGVAYDWTDDESVSFWFYTSRTGGLAAGDLVLTFTDNGGAHSINVPALAANVWTYAEFNISTTANADKDVISDLAINLSAAGAAKAAVAAFDVWIDGGWKWDSTEEEALSTAILNDGVVGIVAVATAAGSANTQSVLTENTDFFVHYETGNDFVVWVTDQSANSNTAFVAY